MNIGISTTAMSNTRTEEIPTGHGNTATVEFVDCCSCGNTVPVESTALAVVMDEDESDTDYNNYTTWKVKHGSYEEGRLCQYCREDPVRWPVPKINDIVWVFSALLTFIMGMIAGGMI